MWALIVVMFHPLIKILLKLFQRAVELFSEGLTEELIQCGPVEPLNEAVRPWHCHLCFSVVNVIKLKKYLVRMNHRLAAIFPSVIREDMFDCKAVLLIKRQHSVIEHIHRRLRQTASSVKRIGPDDLLITWQRPVYNTRLSYSIDDWEKLPEELFLRQIKVTVKYPGFRTRKFYIITTLLDAVRYPAEKLAELYFKRWDVELFFRDIKTTMGMDILRCQTPEMIRKEILTYFIAYNCVRRLMCEASKEVDLMARVVSFKGSVQALRSWEPYLNQAKISRAERLRLISDLYEAMTNVSIKQRPGRSEPRCLKRRKKNYRLMTTPRHEMREIHHRNSAHSCVFQGGRGAGILPHGLGLGCKGGGRGASGGWGRKPLVGKIRIPSGRTF
jgi:hypothetical protein